MLHGQMHPPAKALGKVLYGLRGGSGFSVVRNSLLSNPAI